MLDIPMAGPVFLPSSEGARRNLLKKDLIDSVQALAVTTTWSMRSL